MYKAYTKDLEKEAIFARIQGNSRLYLWKKVFKKYPASTADQNVKLSNSGNNIPGTLMFF